MGYINLGRIDDTRWKRNVATFPVRTTFDGSWSYVTSLLGNENDTVIKEKWN